MAAPAVLGIALLGHVVFGRKSRQPDQRHEQPSPQPTQFRERFGSPQPTPVFSISLQKAVAVFNQLPVLTSVTLASSKH